VYVVVFKGIAKTKHSLSFPPFVSFPQSVAIVMHGLETREGWESKREALFERPLAQSPLLSFAIAEAQLAVKVSLHIQLGENSRRAVGGGDQINQQDQLYE
jgi:hypothetical protein